MKDLTFPKDERWTKEDWSDLYITLVRVIKHHLEEFIRYLKWILVARDEFDRFRIEDPETLTDIQRSVRFYYLLKNGYSSRMVNPTFSVSTMRRSNFNLMRIEEDLSAAHLRLSRVYVENRPYEKLIERFDKPHTFFYLDPPYWGCEGYYGKDIFERADFERLRDILTGIKGRFIMSINDAGDIRSLYKKFNIETVDTTYLVMGKGKKQKVSELLITNFSPKKD